MKIKSIEITGMHKIGKKIYNFSDVTYLHGLNGAGKSTVLQAVQLALLGYIPGQNKTNESIMRHSNGNTLEVLATLDDNGNEITIDRTWVRTKKSIISSVDIVPEVDLSSILAEVELPIFNFSEFLALSANKQKDWFLSFLPKTSNEIDWKAELTKAADGFKYSEDLLNSILEKLNTLDNSDTASLLKSANDYIKTILSFKKSELSRIQSTIDSLIIYDDFVCTESEEDLITRRSYLNDKYYELGSTWRSIAEYATKIDEMETLKNSLADFDLQRAETKLSALVDEIQSLSHVAKALSEDKDLARKNLYAVKSLAVGDGTCPYTKSKCETAEQVSAKVAKDIENAEAKYNSICAELSDMQTTISDKNIEYNGLLAEFHTAKSKLDRYEQLSSETSNITSTSRSEIEQSLHETKVQIKEIDDTLVKLRSNKTYNDMIDKITKDKYIVEQDIEAVKIWIKLTDSNGLQTKYAADSFEAIKKDITAYLQTLFDNKDIHADFNIESKSNSFSFGIKRDDQYIPFDLLSSGEKCLYTIAIMSYIVKTSASSLELVLIDDLLDHLDDSNISNIFKSLQNMSDIQYIFAGVKTCADAESFLVEL